MSQKLRDWMATPAEAKTAWVVAAGCVVLIVTAFIRPLLPDDPAPATETAIEQERHAIRAESRVDEKKQSSSIEQIIEKTRQDEAPAVIDEPVAAATEPAGPVARPETVAVKPKTEEVRKPASANTTITASSDTSSIAAILAGAEMKRSAALPKGYYVQLGAFGKQSGAESLQKRLQPKLENTHVQKKSNGMYAVWAGPYDSKKDADAAGVRIARQTNIKGYTVSH